MKRMKSAVTALLCMLFLCLWITLPVGAGELAEVENYGYAQLKSEAQRYAYSRLLEGLFAFETEIHLDEAKGVTREDLVFADEMLRNDHPECFWNLGGMRYSVFRDTVVRVSPNYLLGDLSGEAAIAALPTAQAALNAAIEEILGGMPTDLTSDDERALWLHDALAARIEYVPGANDQTAYGALVEGRAVCTGYARAYQLLLREMGISAWTVYGSSTNPQTGIPEGHAWNMVFLDGDCYYTDLTWNDQGEHLYHIYYNRSLDDFLTSHTTDDLYVSLLPSCTHEEKNYFLDFRKPGSGIGILEDSMTGAELAVFFPKLTVDGETGSASAYLCYEGTDFRAWLDSNIRALAEALGLEGGIRFSYASLANEYVLTLSGRAVHIPVERISLSTSEVTLTDRSGEILSLSIEPSNATDPTVVWSSSDESVVRVFEGRLTPISNGTAVVRATVGDCSAECTVTVAIPCTEISTLAIDAIPTPVLGGLSQSAAWIPEETTLLSFVWLARHSDSGEEFSPFEGRFSENAEYAVCLTLEAGLDRMFSEALLATVNGNTAEVRVLDATTVEITCVFGNAAEVGDYTVTYVVGDGGMLPPDFPTEYAPGSLLFCAVLPYAEGMIFEGWYCDPAFEQRWEFSEDCIQGNLTLFAKWREPTVADAICDESPLPVLATEASCTAVGTAAHYRCEVCEGIFLDGEGKFRVVDVSCLMTAPMLPHTYESYEPHSGGHYARCLSCGEHAENGALLPHVDQNGDSLCDLCEHALRRPEETSDAQPDTTEEREPARTTENTTDGKLPVENSTSGEGTSAAPPSVIALLEGNLLTAVTVGAFVLAGILLLGIVIALLRKKR